MATAAELPLFPGERDWLRKNVRFRYRMLYFKPEEHLSALSLDKPFDGIYTPLLKTFEGALPLPASVTLACVYSHPIDYDAPSISFRKGHVIYIANRYDRCYVDLQQSFDTYLEQNFRGKTRYTLRKKLRKFEEASGGKVEFVEYKTAEELLRFHSLAVEVSRISYQGRLPGHEGLPSTPAFLQRLKEYGDSGRARGYILFLHGRPVSYLYAPAKHGILDYDRLGYDPSLAHLSPGIVLHYLALQRLFAEREFRLFDLGAEGDALQKELFASATRHCGDAYCFRATPGNMARIMLHASLNGTSQTIAAAFKLLGLKAPLRKAIRKMACAWPQVRALAPE